ncbi:MAG: endonuclease III, partial [Bradymonadaceae bacterium]
MDLEEKAAKIGEQLDESYPDPPIPLDHQDAYTLLVAVLLSAQTTDKRVNKVTPDLFELADNPYEMAEQPVEAIEEKIKTCGLAPTKAKRIKKLSRMLVEDFDGEVPDVQTHLQKLPGVGRKTAQVVLAQWFE